MGKKCFHKIFLLAFLIVFPANALALTATEVLDKVVTTIQTAPSLEVKMNARTGKDSFSAQLTLSREKFRYNAGGLSVYYDGTTQWTVDADAREVSLTNPTLNELAEINPLAFVQNYKANYKVSTVSQGGGSYTVRMVAGKKSSFVRSAEVTINTSTWLPTRVNAYLANGQTVNITITSATKGKALSLNAFRYDTKSNRGYEIIDLR